MTEDIFERQPDPQPDPQPDEQPDPEPDEGEAPALTGWAVYDNTLLRFVTGKLDDEAAAHEIAESGPEGHDLEVRRV